TRCFSVFTFAFLLLPFYFLAVRASRGFEFIIRVRPNRATNENARETVEARARTILSGPRACALRGRARRPARKGFVRTDDMEEGSTTTDPEVGSQFYKLAEQSFGSYDIWKADFVSVGKMRGVGWAICYQDPVNQRLSNHWITLHEIGNVAGFTPALVMDVWEHAFLLDYKPAERPKYIEAFFSNIDWDAVGSRLVEGSPQARSATNKQR